MESSSAASSSSRRPHFVPQHDRVHHRWRWFSKVFLPATICILALYWFGERWTRYSLFRFQEGEAVQQARQQSLNHTSTTESNNGISSSYTPIPTIPIGKDIAGDMVYIPVLGVGTWTFHHVRAYESVCKALGEGYTLIDTAWSYKNQQGVGKAIRDCWLHQDTDSLFSSSPLQALRGGAHSAASAKNHSNTATNNHSQNTSSNSTDISSNTNTNKKNSRAKPASSSGRSRRDLFILTKIPGGLTRQQVWVYHEKNLADLGLTYVDHLMIHYPSGKRKSSSTGVQQRQEEWRALQEIYAAGQARTIGVSHYCSRHLEEILNVSHIVGPSINQMEYHVGSGNSMDDVLETCRQYNITLMSYSPLCGSCEAANATSQLTTVGFSTMDTNHNNVTEGVPSLVHRIAQNYENVTEAQVALRFIVQQALDEASIVGGMGGVIPRTNTLRHMQENRRILDFQLSEKDMQQLHQATQPSPNVGSECEGKE